MGEPFENTYDEKQNDLDDNMDKDEISVNYEEKSCTSPFETDKTEFVTVDDTLVSNEDTLNEKGSKFRLHPTDHTIDSVSFSSLPSDSQILEGHSRPNLLDESAFQEDIPECDEVDKQLEPKMEPIQQPKECKKEVFPEKAKELEQQKFEPLTMEKETQLAQKSTKVKKEKEE